MRGPEQLICSCMGRSTEYCKVVRGTNEVISVAKSTGCNRGVVSAQFTDPVYAKGQPSRASFLRSDIHLQPHRSSTERLPSTRTLQFHPCQEVYTVSVSHCSWEKANIALGRLHESTISCCSDNTRPQNVIYVFIHKAGSLAAVKSSPPGDNPVLTCFLTLSISVDASKMGIIKDTFNEVAKESFSSTHRRESPPIYFDWQSLAFSTRHKRRQER